MSTQPFKNDSFSHAAFIINAERETLQHYKWQEMPLAIVNHNGQSINAKVVDDVRGLQHDRSHFIYLDQIQGKSWSLITSQPVEERKIRLIINWLLRNYKVTPNG